MAQAEVKGSCRGTCLKAAQNSSVLLSIVKTQPAEARHGFFSPKHVSETPPGAHQAMAVVLKL
jgi:hypothetical protein